MSSDCFPNANEIMDFIKGLLPFLAAFAIGCIAATAEIFSRYKEGPTRIFKIKESYFYLVLNGLFSALAYWLILEYRIDLGPWSQTTAGKVILAGISSMVILRSSVASIKNGDKTVEAGLAPIAQQFLDVVDRALDRRRSQLQVKEIADIMKDVDFTKAVKDLPSTCLTVMQNLSREEQESMGRQVRELKDSESDSDITRTITLGIIISKVTGNDLLKATIDALGEVIRKGQPSQSKEDESDFLKQKKEFRKIKIKLN